MRCLPPRRSPFGSSKAASSPERGSPLGITRKAAARGCRSQRAPSSLHSGDAPAPSPSTDHERVADLSELKASDASGQEERLAAASDFTTDSPGTAWQKAEWSPFQDRPLARRQARACVSPRTDAPPFSPCRHYSAAWRRPPHPGQAPRLGRWRDLDDTRSTSNGSGRSLCSDASDEAGGDEAGAHADSEFLRGATAGRAARRALFTAGARGVEAPAAPAEIKNRPRTSVVGAVQEGGASGTGDLAPAAASSPGVVSMSAVTTLADAAAEVASSALRCGRQLYRRSTGSIERMELGSYSSGSVPDTPEPSARSEISEVGSH